VSVTRAVDVTRFAFRRSVACVALLRVWIAPAAWRGGTSPTSWRRTLRCGRMSGPLSRLPMSISVTGSSRSRNSAATPTPICSGRSLRRHERWNAKSLRCDWNRTPVTVTPWPEWKAAQRERTDTFDVLGTPWMKRFVDRLLETRTDTFAGLFSVLYAGDQVAAVPPVLPSLRRARSTAA
jgi:GNAT acetyltransferase-like protein